MSLSFSHEQIKFYVVRSIANLLADSLFYYCFLGDEMTVNGFIVIFNLYSYVATNKHWIVFPVH